jgi:hypothetical protein
MEVRDGEARQTDISNEREVNWPMHSTTKVNAMTTVFSVETLSDQDRHANNEHINVNPLEREARDYKTAICRWEDDGGAVGSEGE